MTDDLESMIAQMRALTEVANMTLAAEQKQIGYGSYWARFYDIKNRIVIFGYVDTLDQMEAGERSLGADDQEADYIRHDTNRRHNDGYMYGMCYSVVTPEGELGFTHRADIWPITQEMFEEFRTVGWDVDHADLTWEVKVSLATMYAEYRSHIMALAEVAEAEAMGDTE